MVKIFLAFQQSDKTYAIPAYGFWQYYIKNGIEEAGYQWSECAEVDWAYGLVPKSGDDHNKWKADSWNKTVAWLKKNPADLLLSYLYPEQVDVTAVEEIKKMGIPCINFFCDNIRDFKKAPKEFAAFDLNWVPEFKAINMYRQAGYTFINLPMPVWIAPALRVQAEEKNEQVTFIGSKDIQRQLFFEQVIALYPQLPLAIYGNGWDDGVLENYAQANYTLYKKLRFQVQFIQKNGVAAYCRKIDQRHLPAPVSDMLRSRINSVINFETYNKLTAESLITAGINRYPSFRFPIDKPDSYSRLRDIEAPMLGACYLTEYTPGLENLYNLENEIATFKNPDDFVEQVKNLQADPKKRRSLRINGQKRALQHHSVSRSIIKIIERLN